MSSNFNTYMASYRQTNTVNSLYSQQFNTMGSWRPQNSTLTLTGGARLYNFDSSNSIANAKNGTNMYLSAYYILSKGMRASGSINVSDNSGVQSITTNASLTSVKSFTDITNIAGFVYKRYISGSLSNQNRSSSGASQSSSNSQNLALSAGHSLTHQTLLFGSGLTSNANQVISSGVSSNGSTAPIVHLSTNGSVSWTHLELAERNRSSVRLSAGDSRNLNSNSNGPVQLFNVQASREEGLARNQSLMGNLTLQLTRQAASANSISSQSTSASAAVNYKHTRAFKVPHLIFLSALRINKSTIFNGQTEKTTFWENNFNYMIGKLEMRLDTRISRINNVNRSTLTFLMKRSF
jgi:hypothetical protein